MVKAGLRWAVRHVNDVAVQARAAGLVLRQEPVSSHVESGGSKTGRKAPAVTSAVVAAFPAPCYRCLARARLAS